MKPSKRPGRRPTSPSRSKLERVAGTADWRDEVLSHLRALIRDSDPDVIEEVKWRKPSNPEGVPVWSDDGMVCVGNILKNAVRLTFPRGAQIKDSGKLFNSRLESKTVRAIDFREGDTLDEPALKSLIREVVRSNRSNARRE